MKKSILFAGVLSVLAGCGGNKGMFTQEQVQHQIDSVLRAERESGKPFYRPEYQASNTRVFDLLHTKLDVSFDWDKRHLLGKAWLTLTPYFYDQDHLVLDAKGMDIHHVNLMTENGGESPLKYEYDGSKLDIALPRTYRRVDTLQVHIDYTAKPDELEDQGGSSAIRSDKGLYFINPDKVEDGFMPQIWTQGETEASSVWFPTIDSPNEKTTQELAITVNDKYLTLSNGKLVRMANNDNGTRTDYWKQDLPHAPYLFMMGIGEFVRVQDSVSLPSGRTIDVDYIVEKDWEQHAKAIFGETPRMINYFSTLLGVEYPWDKYHQIVVREYVSGAMENTSAVIHGDFLYRNPRELLDAHNESIIAHELFHHWFGDLVTCESWANLPMNESFANYSQFLWDEYAHGADEADMNAEIEMDGYIQSANIQGHRDLIRFDYKHRMEMFDGHSYNKGGRILHMLRDYVGDSAFFASLKHFLKDHKYEPVEAHQLRLAFEEVTGEDLNWFFNQWFFAKGHPELKIEQNYDASGKLTVTLEQVQDFDIAPLYKLPMYVDIYTGKNRQREHITMEKRKQTFTFDVASQPTCVIVDGNRRLLLERKETKPLDQYIAQYYLGLGYYDRKEAILEASNSNSADAVKLIQDALGDKFWGLRRLAIENIKYAVRSNGERVKDKLARMASNDEHALVRADALDALAKFFPREVDEEVFAKAMEDPSFTVVSSGLNALAEKNPEKGMQLAKELESVDGAALQNTLSYIYAKHGSAENYDYFVKNLNEVGGQDQLAFMSNFGVFLSRMEPEMAVSGAQELSKAKGAYASMMKGVVIRMISSRLLQRAQMLEVEQQGLIDNGKSGEATALDVKIKALKDAAAQIDEMREGMSMIGQ